MTDNATTVLKPLTSVQRQNILNDLLDSLIKHPKQSNSLRASETARIARRRRVGRMQVAGVRAALTSEVYGKPATLLRNRRRAVAATS